VLRSEPRRGQRLFPSIIASFNLGKTRMAKAATPTLAGGFLAAAIRRSVIALIAVAALCVDPMNIRAAPQKPPAGEMRALIIGIDAYRHVPQLRGAVADARDLAGAMRKLGVRDLKVMLDGEVDRTAAIRAVQSLLARAQPNDTIFLALAGHGAQEPERIKGSEPDGMDAVFLLPGFDPRDPKLNSEKLLHTEFNHFIKAFEDKGARVLFVADACSGGGLAREVDPRAAAMTYRSVVYAPIADTLEPVATRADALLSPIDFKRSLFLAAVDKQSKVPEIKIGDAGYRGALSYALARALEGAADANRDGRLTTAEVFAYVKDFSYQLSDQRQKVVVAHPDGLDPATDVIVSVDRGVSVQSARPEPENETPDGLVILPVDHPNKAITPGVFPSFPSSPQLGEIKEPLRIAVRGAKPDRLSDIAAQAPFQVVPEDAHPDLVWDPATQEAIAGGDVIAHNVGRADLPGVVDRTAAVRWVKLRAGKGPQPIQVFPNDRLHHKGERIEIAVGGVTGRSLILFNIAGDGTVQFLYPIGSDPALVDEAEYRLKLQVREPLGADQLVAISSSRELPELQQALRQLDRTRNPARIWNIVNKHAEGDAAMGSVGVYTAP
jgi:hypothetical protein